MATTGAPTSVWKRRSDGNPLVALRCAGRGAGRYRARRGGRPRPVRHVRGSALMAHEQARKFVSKYLGAKEPLSFEASLSYLRQAGGSNRGAARLAGVGESTLRGWATGRRHPSRAAQERITEAVRGLRTPETSDDRIRLQMENTDRRRAGGKHKRRPVDAEHLGLAPGTMAKARDTW